MADHEPSSTDPRPQISDTDNNSRALTVLYIPELAERIFLEMPLNDLLLRLPLVNKHFRAVIADSPKLQQALFFQPIGTKDIILNPFLRTGPQMYGSSGTAGKLPLPWKVGSCQQMLITQPLLPKHIRVTRYTRVRQGISMAGMVFDPTGDLDNYLVDHELPEDLGLLIPKTANTAMEILKGQVITTRVVDGYMQWSWFGSCASPSLRGDISRGERYYPIPKEEPW